MYHRILLSALLFCIFGFVTMTGTLRAQQQQQQPTIKPVFALSDVAFILQLMDRIELRGDEVTAFIEARNVFLKIAEQAQKDGKNANDNVTVEMSVGIAQNFVTLMQRTKLTGAEAVRFQDINTKMVNAAKVLNEGKK